MSAKKNKRIVERWNEEIFARKNVDAIDELPHEDYKHTTAGIKGREEAKEAVRKAKGKPAQKSAQKQPSPMVLRAPGRRLLLPRRPG